MQYPEIDPLALSLGPLKIHWYGLMYLLGFGSAWLLGTLKARRADNNFTPEKIADLIVYGALGAVLGGRIGYMLFYGLDNWLADPLVVFRVWEGGMSFHGGLAGGILGAWLYGKKIGIGGIDVIDFVAPLTPVGLGFGRIGNFINTELPGRITEVAWGFKYPCYAVRQLNPDCATGGAAFEQVLRHPSSLYQAFAEGVVLMVIMFAATRVPRPAGFATGLFFVAYGVLRILTEFFRSPDAHIGFLLGQSTTMGQLLSLPLVLIGILLLIRSGIKSA